MNYLLAPPAMPLSTVINPVYSRIHAASGEERDAILDDWLRLAADWRLVNGPDIRTAVRMRAAQLDLFHDTWRWPA